jgi:DNA-binding NtrC family response regulator
MPSFSRRPINHASQELVTAHCAGLTVLVVDDNDTMLLATAAILRRAGYCPLTASGPLEALRKSRKHSGPIHLLLTDVVMPGIDGPTLAERLLAERTDMAALLMSGWSKVESSLPLLRKPFQKEELLRQVANLICGPSSSPGEVLVRTASSTGAAIAALDSSGR